MSRRVAAAVIAAAGVVLILGAILWLRSRPGTSKAAAVPAATGGEILLPQGPPALPESATLWLPGAGQKIAPLEVEIAATTEPLAHVRALVGALLAAAPEAPLVPLFDRPVELAACVLSPEGTLFLDFRAGDGGEPPASGSALELQRVFSIVHTVLRNEPQVTRVVLLWNGTQRPSLSGHVDTGHALGLLPALEAR